jgi:hypothetical protein
MFGPVSDGGPQLNPLLKHIHEQDVGGEKGRLAGKTRIRPRDIAKELERESRLGRAVAPAHPRKARDHESPLGVERRRGKRPPRCEPHLAERAVPEGAARDEKEVNPRRFFRRPDRLRLACPFGERRDEAPRLALAARQ